MATHKPPALSLAQPAEVIVCPTCKGRGRIACPPTFGNPNSINHDKWQASTGKPVPCPTCNGRKFVLG